MATQVVNLTRAASDEEGEIVESRPSPSSSRPASQSRQSAKPPSRNQSKERDKDQSAKSRKRSSSRNSPSASNSQPPPGASTTRPTSPAPASVASPTGVDGMPIDTQTTDDTASATLLSHTSPTEAKSGRADPPPASASSGPSIFAMHGFDASLAQQLQSLDTNYFMLDATPAPVARGDVWRPPPVKPKIVDGLTLPSHVKYSKAVRPEGGDDASSESSESDSGSDIAVDETEQGELPKNAYRYYTTEEVDQWKAKETCRNCGLPGHYQSECTHTRCNQCGAIDDHDGYRCPLFVTCWRCGNKGHVISDCRLPGKRGACDLCGLKDHLTKNCHTNWRQYIYRSNTERRDIIRTRDALRDVPLLEGGEGYVGRTIWCFNCAGTGHWGWDCQTLDPQVVKKGISPFSDKLTSLSPFAGVEPYVGASYDPRAAAAQSAFFPDGAGFNAPANPGAQAKKKKADKLRAAANVKVEDDADDDWFHRNTISKSAAGPSRSEKSKRDAPSRDKHTEGRHRDDYGRGSRDDYRNRSSGREDRYEDYDRRREAERRRAASPPPRSHRYDPYAEYRHDYDDDRYPDYSSRRGDPSWYDYADRDYAGPSGRPRSSQYW